MAQSCPRMCCLKGIAVLAGLVATGLLAVAIVISTWIHIEELTPMSEEQLMQLSYSTTIVPTSTTQPQNTNPVPEQLPKETTLLTAEIGQPTEGIKVMVPELIPEEPYVSYEDPELFLTESERLPARPELFPDDSDSSGEVPKALPLYGQMTTWSQQDPPYGGQVAEKRSLKVGLWAVCITKSYIRWRKEAANRISYTVLSGVGEGPTCWDQSPFENTDPEDEGILRVAGLVDLLTDQHFNIPLFTSLGMLVMALLVTSAGIVRNKAVILVGAALYEFSALVLVVSLLWFVQIMHYASNPLDDNYTHYFGRENIAIDNEGLKLQVRHFFGPALYYGIGTFVIINLTTAICVATYSLMSTKAIRHKLVRRERQAVRKGNGGEWLVTKL